jgi:hypothetical protein
VSITAIASHIVPPCFSYNFTSLHSALLYQSIADEAILRDSLDNSNYKISASIWPLPITKVEESYNLAEDSFSAWFLLVLSFPFISASFAVFVVSERESKAKHLQTVAGVKPSAYWLSTYAWDIVNYQLPLWTIISLMYALNVGEQDSLDLAIASLQILTFAVYFLYRGIHHNRKKCRQCDFCSSNFVWACCRRVLLPCVVFIQLSIILQLICHSELVDSDELEFKLYHRTSYLTIDPFASTHRYSTSLLAWLAQLSALS